MFNYAAIQFSFNIDKNKRKEKYKRAKLKT